MELNYSGDLTFGDSEVVELSLRRSGSSVLILQVVQLGPLGAKTALVSFYLKDMIDVSVEGFSHQNVLGGFEIKRTELGYAHPSLLGIGAKYPDHHIVLEPCAGAFGSIKATIERIEFQEMAT
jgi:hypothetical protein